MLEKTLESPLDCEEIQPIHSEGDQPGISLEGMLLKLKLQYSCLENPMDRGAWWATVHGIAKSRTRLSDFTLTFHSDALEKEMATHSSVLAWRIPGTEEPGRLPSLGCTESDTTEVT